MRTHFKLLLFVLALMSCDDNENSDLDCEVMMAKSGYTIGDNLTYHAEALYTYVDNKLTKVENIDTDTQTTISTIEFNYDSKGRIIREHTKYIAGHVFKYYEYAANRIITNEYTIVDSDTANFSEEQFFYIENPKNQVYHDTHNKTSLKFENGNVIEYGSYEVSGTDTIDTFYERYTYDNHNNYFNNPEHRIVIPSDFIWAKITSRNNLIRAQYIDGGWDFSYVYSYGNRNRLIHHLGKSGITIDFEYKCN